MSRDVTIEYVELSNGRTPAREFVDSPADKAAARIDAFIERLRSYGNRMQGKFVKKLTDGIFADAGRENGRRGEWVALSRGRRVTIRAGLQLYRSEKAPLLRKAQKWATPDKHARPVNLFELRVK